MALCFNLKCAYVCNWKVGTRHTHSHLYTHTHTQKEKPHAIKWPITCILRVFIWHACPFYLYFDKLFTNVVLIICRNHSQLMLIRIFCVPIHFAVVVDKMHQEWDVHLSITCVFVCVCHESWRIKIYSMFYFLLHHLNCWFDFRFFYCVDSISFLVAHKTCNMWHKKKGWKIHHENPLLFFCFRQTNVIWKATDKTNDLTKSLMLENNKQKPYQPRKSNKNVIKNTASKMTVY